MPIAYARWEVRESSNRTEVERAAGAYCRALRTVQDVEDAAFYWGPDDSLVVLMYTDEIETIRGGFDPEVGRTLFALGHMARQTSNEIWVESPADELSHLADECEHPTSISVISAGLERIVCEECGRITIKHRSAISGDIDRKTFARPADKRG